MLKLISQLLMLYNKWTCMCLKIPITIRYLWDLFILFGCQQSMFVFNETLNCLTRLHILNNNYLFMLRYICLPFTYQLTLGRIPRTSDQMQPCSTSGINNGWKLHMLNLLWHANKHMHSKWFKWRTCHTGN